MERIKQSGSSKSSIFLTLLGRMVIYYIVHSLFGIHGIFSEYYSHFEHECISVCSQFCITSVFGENLQIINSFFFLFQPTEGEIVSRHQLLATSYIPFSIRKNTSTFEVVYVHFYYVQYKQEFTSFYLQLWISLYQNLVFSYNFTRSTAWACTLICSTLETQLFFPIK